MPETFLRLVEFLIYLAEEEEFVEFVFLLPMVVIEPFESFILTAVLVAFLSLIDVLPTLMILVEPLREDLTALDLEVPVSSAIYEAVYTDITPQEVLSKLMNRKLKKEECYDKVCG